MSRSQQRQKQGIAEDCVGPRPAEAPTPEPLEDDGDIARPCAFSFDGVAWEDATGVDAECGPVVGPLAYEPGWDFYDVLPDTRSYDAESRGPAVLQIRRKAPIRLVRVYHEWPTRQSPLGAALRPEGVSTTSVSLPSTAMRYPRLLVAVCPPVATFGRNYIARPGFSSGCRLSPRLSPSHAKVYEGEYVGSLHSKSCSWSGGSGGGDASGGGCGGSIVFPSRHNKPVAVAAAATARHRCYERRATWHGNASLRGTCVEHGSDPVVEGVATARGGAVSSSRFSPRSAFVTSRDSSSADEAAGVKVAATRKGMQVQSTIDTYPHEVVQKLQATVSELSGTVEDQRISRQLAEAEALRARTEVASLREEHAEMHTRLRSAERATMLSEMQVRALTSELAQLKQTAAAAQQEASRGGNAARCMGGLMPAACLEDVVASLVTLELGPLSSCSPQERSAAKRRLLLKWHPDKNGGVGGGACSDLATRVVQELQSRPEWTL
eukprot:TRINITY_DN67223_c0_g1_i1.p1 TRINITY_DN67223_c0_g1~~TRINITY_DN67223_c0_g1_i1.p1  ORF type:complete len:494 (-),score=72.56 TRINITY_DN67223_c0_g1_i1:158-1639(-)